MVALHSIELLNKKEDEDTTSQQKEKPAAAPPSADTSRTISSADPRNPYNDPTLPYYNPDLDKKKDDPDIISNWEVIIYKNARTSDGGDAGNVVEIEEDTLTVERGSTAEYVIPKSMVEGFDGSEVSLTISLNELNNQYRKKVKIIIERAEVKPRREYSGSLNPRPIAIASRRITLAIALLTIASIGAGGMDTSNRLTEGNKGHLSTLSEPLQTYLLIYMRQTYINTYP